MRKEPAVFVQDALMLPSFADSTVIAGRAGLTHEISSAMVLEATDIENWGKRGQLIITSFYALEHLSAGELALFFRTMAGIGISALAFKPERLLAQAPATVIDLCNDFDLPLIQLSPHVKYESIMLDVLGHILDSNLTLLNRFFDMHRRTMSLALRQPSISDILEALKNLLRADVSYLDTARDRRFGTSTERCAFSAYSFKRRDPSIYQTHAYFDARLIYEREGEADGRSTTERALAVRIPSSDGIDYYLIVHNGDRELSQLDIMAVENIVSLMQMEILKQNAIKQKLFYQNNNTVHDLLLGRFGSHERIDGALQQLGIDRHPHYQALLVRTHMADNVDFDRQDEVQRAIRQQLRALWPGIVYFAAGDRVVFLKNFRASEAGIELEQVRRALERVHANATLPLFTHLAILSGVAGRYELASINNDVVNAYRLFDGSCRGNLCVRFDDLGFYKLLLQAGDRTQLAEFIDPRVTRLAREHEELFETLVAFCGNGLSYPQTAEELFVHPKTVRYRIDRAHELYGIDVRNPDDYLQIIMADKVCALGVDINGKDGA